MLFVTTLPNLRSSAHSGCRACALLLQGLLLHYDQIADVPEYMIRIKAKSFSSSGTVSEKNGQGHLSLEVRWQEPENCGDCKLAHYEDFPDLKLEFFMDKGTELVFLPFGRACTDLHIDDQTPFPAIGRGWHISENPLQDGGLSKVRSMIEDCLSRHSSCRFKSPTTLPRRILDVLLDGTQGIRLHESNFDIDQQRYEYGEYLTLSHCWGSGRMIPKTTHETIQAHRNTIAWSTLPPTFQHAVALTRSLGFRWLWIDALCINQDDVLDKQETIAHMDQIFVNSFMTIAATSAAESSEGLFLPKAQLFKIQATDSERSLHRIFVREQPPHYVFKASFDGGAHMNDWELPFNCSSEANFHTPLLQRAWPYVERLLSPRVLHFTQSEMVMECREGYQCECGRIDDSRFDSRPLDSVKQEFSRIVLQSVNHRDATDEHDDGKRIDSMVSRLAATSLADVTQRLNQQRGEALLLWNYIVTEYSARDLTYDIDRLSVIIGVAKMLAETLRSGYIAGHWTFDTLGLLWYPKDGGVRCRRPEGNPGNNIPSWSWASIEGSPIFFDNSTAMDLACSASFSSERGGEFIWSPTTGGALELTAAMATETILQVDSMNRYSLVKNGFHVEFHPDVSPLRGEDCVPSGGMLICVLVSMTFRSSIIGLVLKQSNTNSQIYRRVGRFECYECHKEDSGEEPEDAEALFEHWFPEIGDIGTIDAGPFQKFIVV